MVVVTMILVMMMVVIMMTAMMIVLVLLQSLLERFDPPVGLLDMLIDRNLPIMTPRLMMMILIIIIMAIRVTAGAITLFAPCEEQIDWEGEEAIPDNNEQWRI